MPEPVTTKDQLIQNIKDGKPVIDKQLSKAITHGHIREATHTLNNAAWRLRQLNKEVFTEWLEEQAQLKKINDKED